MLVKIHADLLINYYKEKRFSDENKSEKLCGNYSDSFVFFVKLY